MWKFKNSIKIVPKIFLYGPRLISWLPMYLWHPRQPSEPIICPHHTEKIFYRHKREADLIFLDQVSLKRGSFQKVIFRYRHALMQLNHCIFRWRRSHIGPIFVEDVEEGHRYPGIYLWHRGISCGLRGPRFFEKTCCKRKKSFPDPPPWLANCVI